MSEVFMNKTATLKEAEDQIIALGSNGTIHLMGERSEEHTSELQ